MDRKALTRKYKETPTPMGVIRVYNSRNGKSLVEASRNVTASLNRHQAQLRMGFHQNVALKREWDMYGAEAFTFEVLDTIAPSDKPGYDPTEDLRVLEDMWLEKLSPFDERGYNKRKARA